MLRVVTFDFSGQLAGIIGRPINRIILFRDQATSAAIDITGWTAQFALLTAAGAEVFRLTSAGGGIVIAGTAGSLTINTATQAGGVTLPTVARPDYVYGLSVWDALGGLRYQFRGIYPHVEDRTP